MICAQAFADANTNVTYLKIIAASNDVSAVIQTLPDVEKLWPQDPDAYLKLINQSAHILSTALDDVVDPRAKRAFINSFTNMMQKTCPTNEAQSSSWVELKWNTIFYFFESCDEIRNDKSNWFAIAKFLGEIRTREIRNYQLRGAMLNGFGFTPQQIAQNQINLTEDQFQDSLQMADSALLIALQHLCPYIQSNKPVDTNFVNQISSLAHLNLEESKVLQQK